MSEQATEADRLTGLAIVRRGLSLSPAIKDGLGLTLLLAILSTIGGSVVPILIQVTVDSGLGDGGETHLSDVATYLGAAAALIVATGLIS